MKANAKGFTLIELLVVIAIIGLLATVVMTSLNSARTKGRDTRRIEDINQIKTALEMYYDSNGRYPSTASNTAALTPTYMSQVPTDPKGNPYLYQDVNSGSSYLLGIALEQDNHPARKSSVTSGNINDTTHNDTLDCSDTTSYCVQP